MRYRLLIALWLLSDVILFLKAFALAYFIRVGWILSSDFPFADYMTVVAISAPMWLGVLLTTRVFALTRSQLSPRNLLYIAYATLVGTAIFALTYYFFYGLFFSRLLLLQAGLITMISTWIWHAICERILRSVLRRDPPSFPALIIGVTRESKALIKRLNERRSPVMPVAILDGQGSKEKEIDGVPVLGKLNKLEEMLTKHKITHLIQCSDLEQTINLLSACRTRKITYMLLPSVLGIVERDERVESLEGHPVTAVSSDPGWMWFFR